MAPVNVALECDYLVIGGGAMGMAFADVVLRENRTVSIVMVDRHARAGGHWNDAYSFVRLHQPAVYYGVPSEELSRMKPNGEADRTHLSSQAEVLRYYELVMDKLKSTGRFRYLPQCEAQLPSMPPATGTKHHIRSLISRGLTYEVVAHKKVVDARYLEADVPSIRPPKFEVDQGVQLVPINGLSTIGRGTAPYSGYVVLGAGKTGFDAVLFLLDNGVDPDDITWIVPNDPWIINRNVILGIPQAQSADEHPKTGPSSLSDFLKAMVPGFLMQLDPMVLPSKWKCSTVSPEELEQLRRIKHVVRLGRVKKLGASKIELEQGYVATDPRKLHINCTTDGLSAKAAVPVFAGTLLTLQSVSTCQQVFSSALIGYIECAMPGEESEKNGLCIPVPHPVVSRDFLSTQVLSTVNRGNWEKNPQLLKWLRKCRLVDLRASRQNTDNTEDSAAAMENMNNLFEKEFQMGIRSFVMSQVAKLHNSAPRSKL